MVQNILEKMSNGDKHTWLVGSIVMVGSGELKSTTFERQITVVKSRIRFSSKLKLAFH